MVKIKNRRDIVGLLMLAAFIMLVAGTSLCSKAMTQRMKDDADVADVADVQNKAVTEPAPDAHVIAPGREPVPIQ